MPFTWDPSLVFLSIFIAIIGSLTALTHAQRMRENSGYTATIWMLAGGSTLGVAIWSMHFIGMLALHLPIPVGYDPFLTLLSLLPAVIASLLAFRVLRDAQVKHSLILTAGVLMGVGISAMHYLGMAAMKMSPGIAYDPAVFALSILIAIVASWAALYIMYREQWGRLGPLARLLLGSSVMGVAIAAMHYTAMYGMHIQPDAISQVSDLRIEPHILAMLLSLTALVWFGGGLLASLFDQRMARKNAHALAELMREHEALRHRSEAISNTMIAALRESEDRLRMTLQNAPDAVFITERDWRIVYVNDNMVDQLGYARNELYAMTIFDLVPEDWRERFRESGRRIVNEHKRHVMEVCLVRRDGSRIPMELNAVLLPNGRVYGSYRDISKRKAAEKALQESREHLHTMMNAITEGLYGVDMQGCCTFVNAAFLRILGFEHEDEVMGKRVHALIHHSYVDGSPYPAAACRIYQAYKTGDIVHCDKEVFWRKDGVAVPVEYWSHPILRHDAVVGAVVTFRDISKRLEKEQRIHQLAFYDVLTHLPNRRLLMERAEQALAISARTGRYGALMLLDLDNFKKLNDSKGHDVGDMLLREVAQRLQKCVREGDTVARLGGDEFVVVLESLSHLAAEAGAQAEAVAEKISAALSERYLLQEHTHQTSSSIGLVMFRGHQESLDTLLKHADIAMYQAKHAGRNTIRFYDPDMQAAIDARLELEAALEAALRTDQLCLYYQIQVDAERHALGAEVLTRWHHPQRGLVSPDEFIPLAEDNGQIAAIGLWVLRAACAQLKSWQHDRHTCDLTLAVNVSAKQFRKADFVDQVKQVLLETGARPSHLKLELTESIVLENVEDTIVKMHELKLLGIKFCLDDFGTGYSSLQYLKRLPLDQIKIDQSFVRDITSDPSDAAIVQTIIAMTKALDLNVIAEGVETVAQQEFLEQHGCQNFQGYLFGKPLPLEEFEASLLGFKTHAPIN